MWMKKLGCKLFHKKTWDNAGSECYDEGESALIHLLLDYCPRCNLYHVSVYRIAHAGAPHERLI